MKISIITICLNNEHLEKTINSVLTQTCANYEYWIIDGMSDNAITVSTLNKYKSHQDINLITEKDEGIYDAMNKGIKYSTGDYIIFLNAGDYFYNNDSLELFSSQHDNCEIVYGDLEILTPKHTYVKKYPPKLTYSFFLEQSLPHPATFIKRSTFEKYGLYDTNMFIASDWAFFINTICLQNVSYKYLPYTISSFDYGGISSKPDSQHILNKERQNYLETNFALFLPDYIDFERIKNRYNSLRNSRLRKYLSYIFKQLDL